LILHSKILLDNQTRIKYILVQLYAFGKGPSATTVTAPKTSVQGNAILIEGTVTDQTSTGRRNINNQVDFNLKGTPAIADENMAEWMEYLFMGQAMPEDCKGVPVKLSAYDPNGNYQDIGTTTSDTSGNFGFSRLCFANCFQTMKKEFPENLVEMLNMSSAENPDRVAMYFMDKKITYRELSEASDRLAQGLMNLGIEKNDRTAIFLSNSPEFVIAYFGIIKAGSIVVPINHMFKQQETEFILEDADASVVITSLAYLDIIRPIKEKLKSLKYIVLVDGITTDVLNFYEIIERTTARLRQVIIDKDSVASILYTSGTTGQPKGAMLSHENFLSNCIACIQVIDVKKTDNFICLLPMFHSFAWTVCVLLPLSVAASITIIDSLRPFRKDPSVQGSGRSVHAGVHRRHRVPLAGS